MNKKYIQISTTAFLVLFGALIFVPSINAELPLRGVMQRVQDAKKEVREEVKEKVKEDSKNLIERAKTAIKERIKRHIRGTLTSISGNTLAVSTENNLTLTVLVSDKTQLKRKFGGTSTLGEFSVNDDLIIIGNRKKNSDESMSSTEVEASYIRNMSIQRRFAVFTGEITAKSSTTVTLKTIGRGTQTVYVMSNTQYKERNKAITFADIQIGNKIVVKGELWNRVNEKIDAKTILKIPSRTTPSPTKSL